MRAPGSDAGGRGSAGERKEPNVCHPTAPRLNRDPAPLCGRGQATASLSLLPYGVPIPRCRVALGRCHTRSPARGQRLGCSGLSPLLPRTSSAPRLAWGGWGGLGVGRILQGDPLPRLWASMLRPVGHCACVCQGSGVFVEERAFTALRTYAG